LGSRDTLDMGQTDENAGDPKLLGPGEGSPAEDDLRPARLGLHDLDLMPAEARQTLAGPAPAQGFEHAFLGGEAGGEPLGSPAAEARVGHFARCEETVQKRLTPAIHGSFDSGRLDKIKTNADNHVALTPLDPKVNPSAGRTAYEPLPRSSQVALSPWFDAFATLFR